jgi:hypothetical protein
VAHTLKCKTPVASCYQVESACLALGLDAPAALALAAQAGWAHDPADGGTFHVAPPPPKAAPFNGKRAPVPVRSYTSRGAC